MHNRTTAASDIQKKLRKAGARYASGDLAIAERLYSEILAEDNDNPEVISRLAAIALQRGDNARASRLWRELLEREIPSWLFLHTLHHLLQTLLTEGATDEARAVTTRYRIPDWPDTHPLDEAARDILLKLVDNLVALGGLDAAHRLLVTLIAARPGDARLLFVLGQLQMGRGDLESAWQSLSAADTAMRPALSFSLLISLMQCATQRKDMDAANEIRHRVATASPAFACPARAGQRATLLVLNNSPRLRRNIRSEYALHFPGNFPSQLSKAFRDDFRFTAVFAGEPAGRAAGARLPPPDLVLNNYTNAETLVAEGHQAILAEFADSFGVAVVNHPDKVPFSAREQSAERIAGIPGLVVPDIVRFSLGQRPSREVADEIEAAWPYPLLTRQLRTQQGVGMQRIENRRELLEALNACSDEALFISPFIDSRGTSGLYRKIRAAVVAGEIIIIRVEHDRHWMVHGRKTQAYVDFYRENRHLLELEDRICRDPRQELGETAMQALQAITERIPLDIFGIDFDVAPDGRLVFYEANAVMNLLSTAVSREVDYPRHAETRMLAAIHRYLLERL